VGSTASYHATVGLVVNCHGHRGADPWIGGLSQGVIQPGGIKSEPRLAHPGQAYVKGLPSALVLVPVFLDGVP
jgi:hypothetical protein